MLVQAEGLDWMTGDRLGAFDASGVNAAFVDCHSEMTEVSEGRRSQHAAPKIVGVTQYTRVGASDSSTYIWFLFVWKSKVYLANRHGQRAEAG